MGQIPSINYEPFLVTLETVKVSERLAAVPLTKATVGDIDSPLFRMFYQARCDDAVRHWYCSPQSRDSINEPPTPEFIYRKFIEEPSIYLQASAQGDSPFTPVPIVLLKLHEPWTSSRQQPNMVDLCLGTGCEVIGYFGCRHFNADGSCDDYGVLGLFLTKAFHNEAKSVAILEIACKCYAHYSALEGLTQTPWPQEVRFSTLDCNLPCLRLIQKLLAGMGAQYLEAWSDSVEMEIDEPAKRFRCTVRGGAVRSFAEKLAGQIDDRLVVRTKSVDPAPIGVVHPVLDAAVGTAKTKWAEANRAVHDQFHSTRNSTVNSATPSTTPASNPSSTASRNSIASSSSDANTAPGTPAPQPISVNTTSSHATTPLPSEPSTPAARSNRSSSATTQVLTMSYNDPYNNRTVYVSMPQPNQAGSSPAPTHPQPTVMPQTPAPQSHEIAHQYAQPQSHYLPQPVMGTPLTNQNSSNTMRDLIAPKLHVPSLQSSSKSSFDISKPVVLVLPKRTMISFWKKGAWLNAQWRCEDRYVRLAPIQHAVDNGLLCLEAVGDNELDVSIFDEWSRPARLRLEQKQFYVPITAPQRIDAQSVNAYPFFMDAHFQSIIQPAARPRSIYQ